MATTFKAMVIFPAFFTPKIPKGATDPKYSGTFLFPPGDPHIPILQAEVDTAMRESYPQGLPRNGNTCWDSYDQKFRGAEYYDVRFSGWMALSVGSPAASKPAIVDMNYNPVLDPSVVYSGSIVFANVGIAGYSKGTGGIGAFLNGVMVTGEEGQFGRLDNRPTVDQMFANAGAAPAATPKQMTAAAGAVTYDAYIRAGWTDAQLISAGLLMPPAAPPAAPAAPPAAPAAPPAAPAAPPAAPAAPAAPPAAPAAPPAAPVAPVRRMTAAANGVTYEAFIQAGWNDDQLIRNGMMEPPAGVPTAFQ